MNGVPDPERAMLNQTYNPDLSHDLSLDQPLTDEDYETGDEIEDEVIKPIYTGNLDGNQTCF